ncbi:MAG: OFA family MFS transporter [Syntrophomonadaceae bacterium]|nr:OFA family MFS transporter [Syntrophomonadaceae bacterium]
MSGKETNRWMVVLAALGIQICLGAIYIWSVFQPPLIKLFGWTQTTASLTFTITILSFAIFTIIAGRIQDQIGPRWVATGGGILLGLGLILAKFTTSPTWLYLTFGVMGGCGIGAAYVTPLATCVKWFPDKKGLITGLAVAGFGGGALVFTPIADKLFIPKLGVLNTFAALGVIFAVLVVLCAQLLKNPPPGYRPAGWTPPTTGAGAVAARDFSTGEMVGTMQFYLIWLTYLVGSAAGLMVISVAKPFAVGAGLSAGLAMWAVMIVSIFNALGRLTWGTLSDKLGRVRTLMIIFIICGLTMFFLSSMKMSMALVGCSLVGFCFGGYLAVYPSLTADYFGTKNLGMNYGTVFVAYGMGAVVGPLLANKIKDLTGAYDTAFVIAAVMCLVALGLAFLIKAPGASKAKA